MIYNLYLFDRHCNCIYHSRWNTQIISKPPNPTAVDPTPTVTSPTNTPTVSSAPSHTAAVQQGGLSGTGDMAFDEETKLVYGVVFSLRNFMNKLSAKSQDDNFISYKTNAYKLHYFETPTHLKLIMTTDPSMESSTIRDALVYIYCNIYVEYVVKNPLAKVDPGYITHELFINQLQKFVKTLPGFE